jgi:CDP-glucose 4,6-dehydratase
MKNVLITGGTGFLGAHLANKIKNDVDNIVITTLNVKQKNTFKALNINSNNITLVKGDIIDFNFIKLLFNEYEFDTVFHLAAISEVRKCQINSKLAFDTNVLGTINILEACKIYNVKSVVVSTSDKAYGSGKLPYKENDPLSGDSIYEVSKSCADLISLSYYKNYNLPVCVLRCCNLYGPYDINISRIIPNTINKILKGENPIIWKGSETSIREFLYIDDAVNAFLIAANKIDKSKGEAFNVGSGDKISIIDLVNKIINKINKNIDIVYENKSFPEIKNQYLCFEKIKKTLNWKPAFDLEKGLDKTIQVIKNGTTLEA